MAVSSIAQIPLDDNAISAATFLRAGVLHVAWTVAAQANARRLAWRRHDGAEGTEVVAKVLVSMNRFAMASRDDGNLVVVYEESAAEHPRIWSAIYDAVTGARLTTPRLIGSGSSPSLVRLDSAIMGRFTLTYGDRRKGAAYIRESFDHGETWEGERPILNARVRDGSDVQAVPFGEKHLSVVQVGVDARPLIETGAVTRTRPVVGCIAHPTLAQHVVVVEATARGSYLADNLRGGLVFDGTDYILPSRVRRGANDGIGDLAVYDVSGSTPLLVGSTTTPSGVADGSEFARVTAVSLTLRDVTNPAAPGALVQLAVAEGHVYGATYREDVTDGGLVAMRLTDRATGLVGAGVHFHGVAVTRGPGATSENTAIVTCRMVGAQNYLGVGRFGATPLAPEWLLGDHALPARADALALTMTGPERGLVYAALADRLCIYRIDGFSRPVRLVTTFLVLTQGRVMQVHACANGNLVCAMGEGGVVVYSPSGEVLAQRVPSTIHVERWRAGKAYTLGEFVIPTTASPYSGQRRRLRCTQAGTSATKEPDWRPSGTMVDSTARWVDDGPTGSVVTGVVVDEVQNRIHAVGVLGGSSGTSGRVYSFDARGLI